jgi:hypothetical protein
VPFFGPGPEGVGQDAPHCLLEGPVYWIRGHTEPGHGDRGSGSQRGAEGLEWEEKVSNPFIPSATLHGVSAMCRNIQQLVKLTPE